MTDDDAITEMTAITHRQPTLGTWTLTTPTALILHGLLTVALRHPNMTPTAHQVGNEFRQRIEQSLLEAGGSIQLLQKLRETPPRTAD